MQWYDSKGPIYMSDILRERNDLRAQLEASRVKLEKMQKELEYKGICEVCTNVAQKKLARIEEVTFWWKRVEKEGKENTISKLRELEDRCPKAATTFLKPPCGSQDPIKCAEDVMRIGDAYGTAADLLSAIDSIQGESEE